MRCPAHEALLQDHLRCFHRMRCAPTWEEALRQQQLAEAAARHASDHESTCPTCHTHPVARGLPAWQAGLY